jgi:hypothetical protein
MQNGMLGRNPHDPIAVARCVQASDILNLSTIPSLPAAWDWSQKDGVDLVYPMFGNNYAGDCVFASACGQLETWSGQTGVEETIHDSEAIDAYSRFTGYNPITGENDNGAVMLDVAKRWARGEKIAGHGLKAFVSIDPTRLDLVEATCNLFGGVWTGWDLPVAWQNADIWDAVSGGEPWGGHAMHVPAMSPGMNVAITWTIRKPITPAALVTRCRECYGLISDGMWNTLTGDRCPSGVDVQKLIDLFPALGR